MLEKPGLYLFHIKIEIWLTKLSKNSISFVDIYDVECINVIYEYYFY